jgi:kynureninase
MSTPTQPDYARRLDAEDPLASFRERFVIDAPERVYLDGNSLGRLPKAAAALAREVVDVQWGQGLIGSWNEGWLQLPERIGGKIARLIGTRPDEVLVADSTSVNLFKLAAAALRARPGRRRVVTDDLNFPSDLYILQSVLDLAGGDRHLEVVRSPDGLTMPGDLLAAALDADTALLALSHTAFKSAFVYDLAAVTEMAHRVGALALWDLGHSAGAMPLSLADAGADLAVGCTYKYVNGGPGAPALLYVRRDLQESLGNPISGWFGRREPFRFALEYEPEPGIRRFLAGTPPVLSLALIEPGVDLLLEAGLERIRAKSVQQTEYLIGLWETLLAPLGFRLGSPREAARRGSHVSLSHPEGLRITRALVERMQVIPDFRPPDSIRLGVCPLYTTFTDIHTAITALRSVAHERLYEEYPAAPFGVT